MKYDIVIFDLDGTLLNTIGDLAASVDYVMRSRNLPEHTDAEYRQMVGGGIRRLVERALPEELAKSEAYVDECVTQFRRYYVDNIDRHTVPYEGMCELLRDLQCEGVKLAVASNKFQHGTDRLVSKFFGNIDFVAVEGNREGAPLKPDPQIVTGILSRAGIGGIQENGILRKCVGDLLSVIRPEHQTLLAHFPVILTFQGYGGPHAYHHFYTHGF